MWRKVMAIILPLFGSVSYEIFKLKRLPRNGQVVEIYGNLMIQSSQHHHHNQLASLFVDS